MRQFKVGDIVMAKPGYALPAHAGHGWFRADVWVVIFVDGANCKITAPSTASISWIIPRFWDVVWPEGE